MGYIASYICFKFVKLHIFTVMSEEHLSFNIYGMPQYVKDSRALYGPALPLSLNMARDAFKIVFWYSFNDMYLTPIVNNESI